MCRTRFRESGLGIAPWVIAGALLLGTGTLAVAQDATPAPIEVASETTVTPAEGPVTMANAVGSGPAPSTVPAAGVGLAAGGTGPLSLGALVGAGVAVVFALRERLKNW